MKSVPLASELFISCVLRGGLITNLLSRTQPNDAQTLISYFLIASYRVIRNDKSLNSLTKNTG